MSSLALLGYGAMALVSFFLSALYSGLETGVYTLNRVRLTVRAGRGDEAAVRLRRELDNPNRTLSTLLIGTNAASYVASIALAAIFDGMGLENWTLIAVEAAVITPLLFVFAETLPKDLFRTHTDHWTYRLSSVLVLTRRVFMASGLLPVVQLVGATVGRLLRVSGRDADSSRQRISQLIKEGVGTGILSESQTTLADRALAMRGRVLTTEMIPWSRVVTVSGEAGRASREGLIRRHSFTRMPVVDAAGDVVGILSTLDALLEPAKTTAELMKEPLTFTEETPVRDALRSMRADRQKMAIVVNPTGGPPRGLVTLKDLVEPVTGELAAW